MSGLEPSLRPSWWQSYEKSRDVILTRMKKFDANKNAEINNSEINKLKKMGFENIYYLPMVSGGILDEWAVLFDEKANIVGYLKFDGFK